MLSNYLTEIISKTEWKKSDPKDMPNTDYRKEVTKNINFKKYKATLPQLKQVMRDLNNGVFKSTLIFDLDTKKPSAKISKTDSRLIQILKNLDYEVSDESYMLGFVNKKDKSILVTDVLNSLDNKNVESMRQAYEKKPNENMKKQIDSLDEYNRYIKKFKCNIAGYKIASTQKYKIVISIQPRLIASQSTKVGWTSCMNLETGINKHYVGPGIQEGVIVAYLAKTGDEHNLNSPTARILLKPFKSHDNILFDVDTTYGTVNNSFESRLIEIFDDKKRYLYGSDLKKGIYVFPKNTYADDINTRTKVVFEKDSLQDKIIKNLDGFTVITKKFIDEIIAQDEFFKLHILESYRNLFSPTQYIQISKTLKGINYFNMYSYNYTAAKNYLKFIAEKRQDDIDNKKDFWRLYSNLSSKLEKFFIEQLIENDYEFSFEIIRDILETDEHYVNYFWDILSMQEQLKIIYIGQDNLLPKTFDKLEFLRKVSKLDKDGKIDSEDDTEYLARDLDLNKAQDNIAIADILKNKQKSPYVRWIDYFHDVAKAKDQIKLEAIQDNR